MARPRSKNDQETYLDRLFNIAASSNSPLGFLLERVFVRVLDTYLLNEGGHGILQMKTGSTSNFDVVVPRGIDQLTGPTAVEFHAFRLTTSIRRVEADISRLLQNAVSNGFRSVLLVIVGPAYRGRDEEQELIKRLENEAQKYPLHDLVSLQVWGNSRVNELLEQYPETVSDLLPELAEASVSKLVREASAAEPEDWKKSRDQLVSRVTQAYRDRGIFLFLGAGCSADAGLPGWDSLINRLLVRLVQNRVELGKNASEEDRQNLARTLSMVESSPLLAARYTRAGLGEQFDQTVRHMLYENVTEERIRDSQLLRQVARMCVPKAAGVRGIITYNFDDLLETHLEEVGVPFESIWNEFGTVSQGDLPVFHVHGFLPRAPVGSHESSEGMLVFSEEGYHRLLNDPYFWANIVQLNYLRERTCLFVGLSLTDPNLRRILDVVRPASIDVARHFIVLRRLSTREFIETAKSKGIDLDPVQSASVLQVHHKLQQDSLQKLGLNIVWYNEHEEVPEILEAIRKRRES